MVINIPKRYPYLWSFFKRRKLAVLATCTVLFGQAGLVTLLPLPVGFIFDKIIKSTPDQVHKVILKGGIYLGEMQTMDALLFLCILGVGLSFTQVLFEWLEQMLTTQSVFKLNEEVRTDLFNKVFEAKQSYIDSRKKVDIMGRISGDVANLEVLFVTGIRALVNSIPTIIFLLTMMFAISTPFTLRFCIAIPVFAFLINYFANKMRTTTKIFRRKTVSFESETHEAVSSLPIIKSFSGDQKLLNQLLGRTKDLTKANEDVRNATVGLDISASAAYHIVRAILVFIGSLWIFQGRLTVGDLIIFISYLGSIMKPVNDIIKFTSKVPKCLASMDRIEEISEGLAANPETSGSESPNMEQSDNLSKPVFSLRNVDFQYPLSKPLFNNLSLDFNKNSLVGIVGQSGNGKTTFSRLVNRLHDPGQGQLFLGEKDLRDFNIKQLRKTIRVLSQDPFLISGSVRDNLLLACAEDLPDSKLEEALDAVNGLEFVKALPEGLNTQIGDGGQQLSGGQAKRIHLARAFLNHDASVFIFDEPTMGLDPITSLKVINSVKELSKTKHLVFWITHRMEEVHLCNSVIFFSAKENPIHASHEDLWTQNSLYRTLIKSEEGESATL